jgi:hypothetical protein
LQRFGQVRIGEIGDVLGVDGIHHHVGFSLDVDGVPQGHAVTGYLDGANVLGGLCRTRGLSIRSRRRLVLVGSCRARSNTDRSEHNGQNSPGAI